MLQTLKKTANMTRTENGAASYRTSGRDCVDLFASIGALRHADENEIYRRFFRAYAEDGDLAMKILFYARDVRGGLGERRVFRSILRRLAFDEPSSVLRNLPYIADYGRWDDVLVLLDTPCHMQALELMRATEHGKNATIIGSVAEGSGVEVITRLGGRRTLDMLYGEGLPRIC